MQINKERESEIVKKDMKKTQKDWIKYFNDNNIKMISAPDIYRAKNKAIIESLKKDFNDSWEVTSTRIIYNKNNLNAEIIHDADSKVAKPKKYKIKIPILNGDFEENKETEKYLQALFDTKDSIAKIIKVIKKFGKDKKIRFWTPNQSGLWTPNQSDRKSRPIRSVGLCFYGFVFVVSGDVWFGGSGGLSRGVIIDSAKQTKKSRGKSKW